MKRLFYCFDYFKKNFIDTDQDLFPVWSCYDSLSGTYHIDLICRRRTTDGKIFQVEVGYLKEGDKEIIRSYICKKASELMNEIIGDLR